MEDVTGAVFEDNFFDLPPGGRRSITVLDRAQGHRVSITALNAETVRLVIADDAP